MPFWLWQVIPATVQTWCHYRIFEPTEQFSQQEVKAHPFLADLCAENNNSFALSPSTLLFLWRFLCAKRPRRIVEFGCGLSTRVFAGYAEYARSDGFCVNVCSIEHDENWQVLCKAALAKDRREHYVELLHAPLTSVQLFGKTVIAYDVPSQVLQEYAGDEGYHLCLIDGPPGSVGRIGSLPIVAPFLAPGATVLLDDAYRPGEIQAIKSWKKNWKDALRVERLLLADSHGMASLTWNER